MILAFDTYYFDNKAKTVCIAFNDWADPELSNNFTEVLNGVEDYEPGLFYKRELPCILSLLNKIDYGSVKTIVVDGFVTLDDNGKNGLGGHLFDALNQSIPIIGVAKTGFYDNHKMVRKLLRGESQKPLFITTKGMELDAAVDNISRMHGSYRMPTLLQILDTQTKEKQE